MAFDRERYQGLAGLRRAMRAFLAASEAISRAGGVTAQQYQALLVIGCEPAPLTMKDLSEQLLLSHHAAVQMVDRLGKAGLVARAPSLSDRRSVLLKLTPQGEGLLDRLASRHLDEILKQEPQLTASLKRLRQAAG